MPKKLTDCVKKVKGKGMPEKSAWPICVSSTGEKPHKKSFDDYVVNQISKGRKDIISGGMGDKTQPKDVDKKQLDMGLKVEKEHTTNKKIAKEIALDHLTEDKKYYSKLAVMEGKGGKSAMVKKSIGEIIDDRINSLYKAPIVNKDTQSFTDITDMSLAKLSTPASLQSLLAESVRDLGIGETKVIPLDNGKSLKIYRVEEGIYSGHILEEDGSISHNIDRSTIPEIAAHLVVKNAGNEEAEENEEESKEAEIKEKETENGKENETEIKQENEGNRLVINININKAKNMNLDDKINSLYKAFDPMKFKKKNKKDEDEEDIDKKDGEDVEKENEDEDIQEINTPPKEDEGDEDTEENDTEGEDVENEEDEDVDFGDDNEDPENEFPKKDLKKEFSKKDSKEKPSFDESEDDGQNDSPDLQGNPSQYENEPSSPEKVELKQEGDADAHSNITYPEGYTPGASEHDSVDEQADNGIAPQGQVGQPQVDENGNPVLTPNKKKLISHLLDIAKQHHDGDDSDSVNDISKFLVHLHRGDNNQDQTGHTQQPIKKSKVAQSLSKGDIKLTNEENKLIFDVAVKDMLTSAYLYCKFRHPEFSRKEIMSKIANKAISDIARKMQWDEKFVLAKRAVKFDEKYLLDLIKQLDLDEIDESIANKKTAPEEMFYSTEGRQVFGMQTKSSTKMIDVLEKGNNFFGKPIQSKTLNVKFKEVDYCELAKGKIEKKTDVMMKSHIEKLFKK